MRALLPLIALLSALTLSACQTTYVHSKPARATVVLDEERVIGQTPLRIKSQPMFWTTHRLSFHKEGYAPASLTLRHRINPAFCVASFFASCVMWPIWMLGEARQHTYTVRLKQVEEVAAERAEGPLSAAGAITFKDD